MAIPNTLSGILIYLYKLIKFILRLGLYSNGYKKFDIFDILKIMKNCNSFKEKMTVLSTIKRIQKDIKRNNKAEATLNLKKLLLINKDVSVCWFNLALIAFEAEEYEYSGNGFVRAYLLGDYDFSALYHGIKSFIRCNDKDSLYRLIKIELNKGADFILDLETDEEFISYIGKENFYLLKQEYIRKIEE